MTKKTTSALAKFRKHSVGVVRAMTAAVCLSIGLGVMTAPEPAAAQAGGTNVWDVTNGTDNSANLGSVNNFAKTVISFCVNVLARVIGVGVGLWALLDFVKRDVAWGAIKLAVCGACFFLPNILSGIANIAA